MSENEKEFFRMLACLPIAMEPSVAADITKKALAYINELREELEKAREENNFLRENISNAISWMQAWLEPEENEAADGRKEGGK